MGSTAVGLGAAFLATPIHADNASIKPAIMFVLPNTTPIAQESLPYLDGTAVRFVDTGQTRQTLATNAAKVMDSIAEALPIDPQMDDAIHAITQASYSNTESKPLTRRA